jgi:hypothetical protein
MLDIAGGIIIAATAFGMMRWGVNLLASDQYHSWPRVWGYVFCLFALGFMYWLVIGRFLSAQDLSESPQLNPPREEVALPAQFAYSGTRSASRGLVACVAFITPITTGWLLPSG